MKYNVNEYLIIRVSMPPTSTVTSAMEIMLVTNFDEKNLTYTLRTCEGANLEVSERYLKGNSYKLDLTPEFLIRLSDREVKVAGQKMDERYLICDLLLADQTRAIVHVYVEGSAVYYYPCGFEIADSRVRVNTFEEFQIAVRSIQKIEMLFEVEAITKAYGKIDDPLVSLLSRLFDCSTCYGQCKQQEEKNTDSSKAKDLEDKKDAAKERFLSVCRAIDLEYRSTPEKSPILQDLFEKMNVAHQGHFGTTAM